MTPYREFLDAADVLNPGRPRKRPAHRLQKYELIDGYAAAMVARRAALAVDLCVQAAASADAGAETPGYRRVSEQLRKYEGYSASLASLASASSGHLEARAAARARAAAELAASADATVETGVADAAAIVAARARAAAATDGRPVRAYHVAVGARP